MDEADWLKRLKAKDEDAFNQLVQKFGTTVLNTCFKFLLNKKDAEDISQEVFIEIYQSVKSFQGDSSLSTWIYRITVTKCLDELKKQKRKKRIGSFGKIIHLDLVANWIAGGAKADKELDEKEKMKEVREALNALPDSQRVAYTLSKIDGYSNPEIAEILDTTVEAVESLIYRAKRKVSDELKNILQKND